MREKENQSFSGLEVGKKIATDQETFKPWKSEQGGDWREFVEKEHYET